MSKIPPAGFNWVMPYIIVKDVDQSLEFYEKAFGFSVIDKTPGEDGTTWHAEMQYQDQRIMFGKEGAWGGTTKSPISTGVDCPINLYLYTDNVDKLFVRAKNAGAKVATEPQDMFWGDRMCNLLDIDHISWAFATPSVPTQ